MKGPVSNRVPARGLFAACVGTASALLFQSSLALAFRTTADLAEYGEPAARWEPASVSFQLHHEVAPGLEVGDVEVAVVEAWSAWDRPACSAVDVYNLGVQSTPAEPGDGRNTIQWVSDWTARGFDPTAPGATDVQYERTGSEPWRIVEADIYLNAEHFAWGIGDDGEHRDVVTVVTHEMGHALGLLHPCEPDGRDGAPRCEQFPDADGTTMHPLYDPEQATLSPDDEDGICSLYPEETCATSGCPEGFSCTERGCEPDCDPECGAGRECVAGRCIGEPVSDPCRDGGACADAGANSGSPIGYACADSSECAGGECLEIDGEPAVCTRRCDANLDCPESWTCEEVEARSVCAPPWPVAPSGGCALRPAAPGDSPALLAGLSVLFGLSLRLRRRQRSGASVRAPRKIRHDDSGDRHA